MQTHANIIQLTSKAVDKVKKFAENKHMIVKFGITRKGCSGYMYDIGFVKEPSLEDTIVEQDGAKVVVSKDAVNFLKGSTIDYSDSLLGAGFKIDNPNVTKKCKCGHSVK